MGDTTKFTDDSFTFKAKNNLDTTQTTTNTLFSLRSNKIKLKNIQKKEDDDELHHITPVSQQN